MDIKRIPPSGDPFQAAAHNRDQDDHPCVCYEGVVYIGHLACGEDGEEVEVFESVPCRRCAEDREDG